MLKKTAALFFSLIMCITVFSGCTANDNDGAATESSSTSRAETSATNVADTTLEATNLDTQKYSKEKVVWGPGNITNHQRPTDPENLQAAYSSLGASFLLPEGKQICLTFDEGYENGYTGAILDTLKEKKVQAIFFVTYDFASQNPDLIKRMISEGHIVGNHTYRHYTMDEVTEEAATEEIVYLHQYIQKNYNYQMKYFRFPKGEFSEATLALAKSLGYKSVFWSFAYEDWDTENVMNPQDALKKVTESTHPGAIYLLHAVSSTNAEILGDAIDNIRQQSYTFTTSI